MDYNYNYEDPILIDVNSKRNKRQSILCVICKGVQLKEIEEMKYKCPRCKNIYQLGFEILEHEDDFESSHEDEDVELSGLDSNDSNVGLLTENDYDYFEDDEDEPGSIPIPKYMKDSETTKVIEYHEE